MIKSFSNETCAFDCEWVPCAQAGRRLLGLDDSAGEGAVFEAMWQTYRKLGDPATSRPFLKLALSKVVSIAAVFRIRNTDGSIELELFSRGITECGEGKLIGDFLERVAEKSPAKGWQLWGFNSSGSDLPILKQRAIALGVACPKFSLRPDRSSGAPDFHDDRYSGAHIDILGLLGNYGRGDGVRPSLDEFAAACGIPGKMGVSGDQVADLYLEGKEREIVEYNQLDALTTHLVMLKIAFHSGRLGAAAYCAETEAVEQFLEKKAVEGGTHLQAFLELWERRRTGHEPATAAPIQVTSVAPAVVGSETTTLEWDLFVKQVQNCLGLQIAAALRSKRSFRCIGDRVVVAFGGGQHAHDLVNAAETLARVEEVLSDLLGQPTHLVCEMGDLLAG